MVKPSIGLVFLPSADFLCTCGTTYLRNYLTEQNNFGNKERTVLFDILSKLKGIQNLILTFSSEYSVCQSISPSIKLSVRY